MRLLEPLVLSALALPNRTVFAPLMPRRAGAGNLASPAMASHYAGLADAGLVITERIEVDPASGSEAPAPPVLSNLAQTRSWRGIVDAVHARGGRIFAQLSHPGRVSHPDLRGGHAPIAPSPRAAPGLVATPGGAVPMPVPHALAQDEIPGVIDMFADAAAYALAAGFDGVEVHAAGGFLIDQFLHPESNVRRDAYGGSTARRARFLLEVVEAVAGIWGVGRVGVRLSPWRACNGMSESTSQAAFAHVAGALDQLGIAFLHVIELPAHRPSALAQARRHFGGAVIAGGDYTREAAEVVIAAGLADCVAFCGSFLTAPHLSADAGGRAPH